MVFSASKAGQVDNQHKIALVLPFFVSFVVIS